jgi:F-box/leucine-rich repeat protein 2/20
MFTDAAADVAPPPSPDDDPRATSLGRVDARDDDDDPPDEIRDRLRHVQEACDATTVDAPFPTLDLSGSHHAGDAIERVTCFGDAVVRGLRTLRLEFALRLEDSHVAALAPSATLEDVNLNGAQSVGDDAVIAIARANPGLRDIGLYWNVRVTDDAIATLCASCPALRSINLSGCKRLTDASAKSLSKLRRVESLNLTRCAFTDDGLTAIVLSPGIADHLVSLNLYAAARYTSRAYRCVGVLSQVRSIHWSPYDRVGVVNADP